MKFRKQTKIKTFPNWRRLSTLLKFIFIGGHWFFWHWWEPTRGQKFMDSKVSVKLLQTDLIIKLWAAGRVVPSDPSGLGRSFRDRLTIHVQSKKIAPRTTFAVFTSHVDTFEFPRPRVKAMSAYTTRFHFSGQWTPRAVLDFVLFGQHHLSTAKCRHSDLMWTFRYCYCDKEAFSLSFVSILKLPDSDGTAGEQRSPVFNCISRLVRAQRAGGVFQGEAGSDVALAKASRSVIFFL